MELEAIGVVALVTTLASSSAVFIGAKIFISIVDFCSKKITNYFLILNIYSIK